MGGEVLFDLVDQVRCGMERSAAQGLVREFPEPALDEVEPRGRSGGEMQLEPGTTAAFIWPRRRFIRTSRPLPVNR